MTSTTTTTQPLVLHAHPKGAAPLQIAILLQFLHVPYNVKLWTPGAITHDPRSGSIKSGALKHLNPNERLPILEDTNTRIVAWESGAIVSYLLRVYDIEGRFGPREEGGEKGRCEFEAWNMFLLTGLAPMMLYVQSSTDCFPSLLLSSPSSFFSSFRTPLADLSVLAKNHAFVFGISI